MLLVRIILISFLLWYGSNGTSPAAQDYPDSSTNDRSVTVDHAAIRAGDGGGGGFPLDATGEYDGGSGAESPHIAALFSHYGLIGTGSGGDGGRWTWLGVPQLILMDLMGSFLVVVEGEVGLI